MSDPKRDGQIPGRPDGDYFVYRLLDDATGLYWNGAFDPQKIMFGEERQGAEFRGGASNGCEYSWRRYEATREFFPERDLPKLTRVTMRVIYEEIDKQEDFVTKDKPWTEALFSVAYGGNSNIVKFVRSVVCQHDFEEFGFIIERRNHNDRKSMKAQDEELAAMTDRPIVSSRRTNRMFLAVRTEKDFIFAKMFLGEDVVKAFNMKTAKPIQ